MAYNSIESMDVLVNELSKLPGVGKKTAQRYAYFIISNDKSYAESLSNAIKEAKENIHECPRCGNFTDTEECAICSRTDREPIVCVVKEPKDVMAIDRINNFKGTYHVLHGVINPIEGKGPNDINLASLLRRVNEEHIKEVIVATNPDVEGEATAIYISNLLKPLGVTVTRIAQGISIGSELEFADAMTLSKAIDSRRPM